MVRPADTPELRGKLDRFIAHYVRVEPSILGVRVVEAGEGPYLDVGIRRGAAAPRLPPDFEGLAVVAREREPSPAAVGPLR